MKTPEFYPRLLRPRVLEALSDSPVVLIHGPRQCGKTTLARLIGDEAGFAYFTFDDDVQRAAAQADPVGYVADLPERAVLDEVQRVPELFTSLKAAVDARRTPGRFLLTGSANVLLVPRLADSLAGRMEILRLHPLAQAELARTTPEFLTRLFGADFQPGKVGRREGQALADRVASGGYPVALARATPRRQAAWYRDYADTLI
ncbi:MAG: AAA family ATPase [Candidatus Erginobacter occultus]|nr:AAA family ATPase [Candidatus Erginobacter occultus]